MPKSVIFAGWQLADGVASGTLEHNNVRLPMTQKAQTSSSFWKPSQRRYRDGGYGRWRMTHQQHLYCRPENTSAARRSFSRADNRQTSADWKSDALWKCHCTSMAARRSR